MEQKEVDLKRLMYQHWQLSQAVQNPTDHLAQQKYKEKKMEALIRRYDGLAVTIREDNRRLESVAKR